MNKPEITDLEYIARLIRGELVKISHNVHPSIWLLAIVVLLIGSREYLVWMKRILTIKECSR